MVFTEFSEKKQFTMSALQSISQIIGKMTSLIGYKTASVMLNLVNCYINITGSGPNIAYVVLVV